MQLFSQLIRVKLILVTFQFLKGSKHLATFVTFPSA